MIRFLIGACRGKEGLAGLLMNQHGLGSFGV